MWVINVAMQLFEVNTDVDTQYDGTLALVGQL